MRIGKTLLLIFLVTAILCNSCYEPENLPLNEIKPSGKYLVQNVNFFPSDQEIILYGEVVIDVSMNYEGVVKYYELLLDGKQVYTGINEPKLAYFDTKEFADGSYTLELRVYFETSTNSVADQLGFEAFVYSVDKSVIIDNTSGISKPTFKTFTISNGELYLEVEPYADAFGFESWELLDKNQNIISTQLEESGTQLLIPGYFGQSIDLYVRLNAKLQSEISELIHYEWEFDFETTTSEGSIRIDWKEPPFNNYRVLDVYNWSGSPYLISGRESVNINISTQFYYRYLISLTVKGVTSGESAVGTLWARSKVVTIPPGGQTHRYTFRNDSILSVFAFIVDGNSFDYGDYSVVNYTVRSNPLAKQDDLIELNSQTKVAFSRNFSKVAQIGGSSFSFLDTLTLQPTTTYYFTDMVSPADVTQVYLSNDNIVGLLHNQNTTITLYDLAAGVILASYAYDCTEPFTYGQSYDINQAGLLFGKAYEGRSTKLEVIDGRIGCPIYNNRKTFWFDNGYPVELNGGSFPYNNYNEIAIKDLSGATLMSRPINNAFIYPGIYENIYFLVHIDGYVRGYDLANNIQEVFRFSFSGNSFPSLGFIQPQLKKGRFSILTSDNELYFKDFN
ncbi:MAG: hypothetical protein K8H85_07400 [Cyclobacteriaceae bacterium]|nr:hypothetical protein [Cyclobacteriaceae bacterium]